MSIQTMVAATETIVWTITGGGDEDMLPPNSDTHHQNPEHIRDTFDIALRWAPGGPRRPGGPRGPGGPGGLGGPGDPHAARGIPPTHLIPILPGADLKPAGLPPQVFNGDWTWAEAFLQELRLYIMANYGVSGFESPIRWIAIALTFIKGLQVDGWVEGILQALEQLNPIADNVEYIYIDFLVQFEEQFVDSTK
jgi:hypothetical protein